MSEREGRSKIAIGAGAALGATVVFAPAAEAATFTVTNLNDSGPGSLRQAVLDSEASGGLDEIVFQSALSGTIALTTGDLDVTQALDVRGPGAGQLAISGNFNSRVFYVNPTASGVGLPFSISGLTLKDGRAPGNPAPQPDGGAIFAKFASVTIADSVLQNNAANLVDGGDGGALYTDGAAVTIRRSAFIGNEAQTGGAMYVDDDADTAQATTLTISDSVFSANTASEGNAGAIYIDDRIDGDVLIERTTVVGNQARNPDPDPANVFARGGGILFYGPESATAVVRDSLISGNVAEANGGGISTYEHEVPVTIRNTTISGNTAGADGVGDGGGLEAYNDPVVNVQNSTIAGNTAIRGGGIFRFAEDDPGLAGDNTVTLSSTIVGDNSAGTGPDLSQGATPAGTFALGFSLIENLAAAVTTESPVGSNITGTDPLLGPLAANGGPTQTHVPQVTSPAIDAGIANGLTTDQRGFARTADLAATANRGLDGTDIGAVELRAAACQGTNALAEFNATDGNDTLTGTEGADSISGLAGNDTVKGAGGKDCVNGDEGNDKLRGQGGKDTAKGGDGNDNLSGGGGKDKVVGGAGKDKLKGAKGKDALKGNAGKDTLKAADGAADKVNCGSGEDKATVDAKDKVAANCEDVTEKG